MACQGSSRTRGRAAHTTLLSLLRYPSLSSTSPALVPLALWISSRLVDAPVTQSSVHSQPIQPSGVYSKSIQISQTRKSTYCKTYDSFQSIGHTWKHVDFRMDFPYWAPVTGAARLSGRRSQRRGMAAREKHSCFVMFCQWMRKDTTSIMYIVIICTSAYLRYFAAALFARQAKLESWCVHIKQMIHWLSPGKCEKMRFKHPWEGDYVLPMTSYLQNFSFICPTTHHWFCTYYFRLLQTQDGLILRCLAGSPWMFLATEILGSWPHRLLFRSVFCIFLYCLVWILSSHITQI